MHHKTALILAAVAVFVTSSAASSDAQVFGAPPTLIKVSADPFSNPSSQHKTEVEPATATFGNMIVSAFQTGRVADGGSADIGWATSADGGASWRFGFMPGITKAQKPTNKYDAVSDPSVAFDRKHGVWLVSSLPISNTLPSSPAVLISRSTNGINWLRPVGIAPRTQSADKNWVTCDNTPTSPFYGHCYNEWDEPAGGDLIMMSKSSDGGATWSRPLTTQNQDAGLGGEPLVQPNGTVIVPIEGGQGIGAYRSTDGGHTWSGLVNVAEVFWGGDPGGVRASPLPSASMDANGKIYVSWEDCRFRLNCTSNDIVYTTSMDGLTWTPVKRVPIDAKDSGVDHFDPGFGVQPTTSGPTTNIGVYFYFFSNANCNEFTCQLGVGFISSHNGGSSWNPAIVLAGPMKLDWLPQSQNGLMVGDYITTGFINDLAWSVFAVANAPTGGVFDEAMYVPAGGLAIPQFGPQRTATFDVAYNDQRFRHHWTPLPPKSKKASKSSKAVIEHD